MVNAVLGADTLAVAFQPIVHLPTGRVIAHEVLGRARSALEGVPARGPVELIEQAVRSGGLLELEHAWRRLALETIAARGPDESIYFLNVDTRVVQDPRFVPGTTRRLLAELGMSPRRFVFELTERDPALGATRLSELLPHYADQGFGIALDDLGSGHASLQVLVQLRPKIFKLDRELVAGVSEDPLRQNLLRALALFARLSELTLIAEGIETDEDLNTLRELGVTHGQGYLLGRPMPEPCFDCVTPTTSRRVITPRVWSSARQVIASRRVGTPQ